MYYFVRFEEGGEGGYIAQDDLYFYQDNQIF